MKKKRFIVEIEIPDDTGDLCWDQDVTGLQAFHDCVVSVLPQISLRDTVNAVDERVEYRKFIERECNVRESFRVVKPIEENPLDDVQKI